MRSVSVNVRKMSVSVAVVPARMPSALAPTDPAIAATAAPSFPAFCAIAGLKPSETQRLPHLLDDLHVGRDTRRGTDVEPDHQCLSVLQH